MFNWKNGEFKQSNDWTCIISMVNIWQTKNTMPSASKTTELMEKQI